MRPLFFVVAVVAMTPIALPAHAEQWWVLYRSDPSSGVLDACKRASPTNDFVTMSAGGFFPQYVYHDGYYVEIVVVAANGVAANGQEVSSNYFHSLDACQAIALSVRGRDRQPRDRAFSSRHALRRRDRRAGWCTVSRDTFDAHSITQA